ncbi:helix-turn-helix domain-containing protein [Streptomyces sp. NPDC058464]|uniref:helix-turn-helix domain-containing protein n=1 Tax=Streptomyces sp. NPDC058464 TaxID=3346511 RepID=UPI00364FB826
MPGATGADATEAFALLLRELKDRSGLSYGALAKRLHMSTSTLHRYCNGTAVPVEYAPVERLARVCRATPEELVALHRRWILADAARGSRGEQATAPDTAPTADPGPRTSQTSQAPHGPGERGNESKSEGEREGEGGDPVVVDLSRGPVAPRRRRTVLIASVAVAAVLGAVVLAARLPLGGGNGGAGEARAAGDSATMTGTTTGTATGTADTGKPSAAPSPTGTGHRPSASAATTPAGSGGSDGGAQDADGTTSGAAVPLTVNTRPYVYDDPCSQHFLVDSEPAQVGPPANEQDAPRWAAAYGAVSSGEQEVALTVQGTGAETVVLEALHVRVLSKGAPLAWNDYSMGVGCGGGVGTKSFDIDLDNGSPTVTAKNGQRDFPYKVSESDPEVFYVFARTKAHDVRWDLTLDWSSGSRRGTVHVDNAGTAFRTSADVGRPGYDYPLGGSEWIERVDG